MSELQDGFGSGPVVYRSADAGVAVPVGSASPTQVLADGFGEVTRPVIFDRLNQDQKKIIAAGNKRKLIVAGAGTGKTSGVLLPMCEELYRRKPGKIGIFSFGVAIKEELEEKVRTELSFMAASKTKVMTNHGLGLSLVMRNLELLGLPLNSDIEAVVWKMVVWFREQAKVETGLSKAERSPTFRMEFNQLSDPQIKAMLALEEVMIANGEETKEDKVAERINDFPVLRGDRKRSIPAMPADIVRDFIHWAKLQRLVHGKLMFRDLLPLAAQLPEDCFRQLQIRHILVDEAQDLSADQHAVIRKLSEVVDTTLFVGDPAQCIYRFSGSRPDLFMGISKSYDEVEQFTLGVNYRCDEPILDLANHLLKNIIRSPVRLTPPHDRQGTPIDFGVATGDELVAKIRDRIVSGEKPKDMVVLTRTNSQLLGIELALTKAEITYNCWSGSLFEDKSVDDFLAYIRFLAGERTYSDWETIVSHVKFLGKKTGEEAWNVSGGDPLKMPSGWHPHTIKGDQMRKRWFDLMNRLRELRTMTTASNPAWPKLLHMQLTNIWEERWPDDPEKFANAEDIATVFVDWAQSVADPATLLDKIETMSVQDPNGIVLSTLHKFKGLERNTVILWNIGIGDGKVRGLFPLHSGDYEEEACIFYVGVTRAKHHLILLKAEPCEWPYEIEKMFCPAGLLFAQWGTQNPCITCPHQFACLATLSTT